MKKNKYREVIVKEIEREVYGTIMCIKYHYPDLYEDSCIELSENTFGIKKAKMPKKIMSQRVFGAHKYKNKPYSISVEVFSGVRAFIYALINPITNNVFYIGTTSIPVELRLLQHISDSTNQDKSEVIRGILAQSQKPIVVPLCSCPVEIQYIEEKRWIKGARKKFKLTNKS